MADDIYVWSMSARPHKDSVSSLVLEIRESHANQTPLPVSIITSLLPLQSNEVEEMNARGDFVIEGDSFLNEASEELWVEFYDPVMEEFNTTLPESWSGKLIVSEDLLVIEFDTPLEIELPRIAAIGVDRSSYQKLTSIRVNQFSSVSTFEDSIDESKKTWIQAVLSDTEEDMLKMLGLNVFTAHADSFTETEKNPLISNLMNENSSGCGGDANDPDWYVYRRRDGICIIHYGRIIQNAHTYSYRFGPYIRSECVNYVNNSCPGEMC